MNLLLTKVLFSTSDRQEIHSPGQMAPDNLDPAVTAGSSQSLQQMGYNPTRALEIGESNAASKLTSEPSRKHELVSGILRIVPSDADVRNATTPHQRVNSPRVFNTHCCCFCRSMLITGFRLTLTLVLLMHGALSW